MNRRLPELDPGELASLAHELAAGRPVEAAALARVSRAICRVLATRHPGRSVELRVPPVAAVQLGPDDVGAHRRGTPPNVVELPPAVLVQLAAGTLTWADAVAAHLIRASGVRSDLSAAFPLAQGRSGHTADP